MVYNVEANPQQVMGIMAPMFAVSAMTSQFALLRLTVPGAPSTAVMTGNTTNLVLSLLDNFSRGDPLIKGAKALLNKTLGALIGFFAGCLAGAAAVSWLGNWAWSLPVAVAVIAIMIR